MPTYEYACVECGNHIEVVQSMSDPPLAVCAACGGRLRKVFSPIGIVFKGSGFYRTDSRGRSSTSSKETSSKETSSKETSSKETSSKESSSTSKSSGNSSSESSGSSPKPDSSSSSSKSAEKSA